MRKLIATLLLFSFNAYTLPPVAVNGEQQANAYVQNIKVPNYQSTALGGVDRRIETGNTNLLINPSFEDTTAGANWTATNATVASTAVDFTDGKKGLTITPSVAGGGIKQTSILYAAKIIGGQGIAKVSVKTAGSDVIVCPLINGSRPTDVTKFCSAVPVSSTSVVFPEAIIPFILDGTSNGIEIYSTGTSAFTIDEAFVGKAAPFQGVNGAKLVGALKITACSAAWSTSSATYASFAAQTGCTYTATGQAQAPSTNIPAIKFSSLPAGDYRLEYEGGYGPNTVSTQSWFQFSDGTNATREESYVYGFGSTPTISTMSQTISYSTTQSNITFEIKAKATAASAVVLGTSANPGVIKVWYFPPESKIYSQNGDIVSNSTSYTAQGNISGVVSNQNVTGWISNASIVGAIYTYPISGFTVAPNCWAVNTTQGLGSPRLLNTTSTSTTVSVEVTNNAGATASTTMSIGCQKQGNDYSNAFKPIIVGSFAGLEKCANDYECTDTFSAHVDTVGAVTGENIDWISGPCSVVGSATSCTYNTNLKDGTSALSGRMNCVASMQNLNITTQNNVSSFSANTLTGFTFLASQPGVGNSPREFDVKCQKGTQDYKAKTAKIASSIGVPTVPGIVNSGTGNAIDTFSVSYFGATTTTNCTASCTLDQIGSAVSSISASGTIYTINFTKNYSKIKCSINGTNAGVSLVTATISGASLNSTTFSTAPGAGASVNSYGLIQCQGTY